MPCCEAAGRTHLAHRSHVISEFLPTAVQPSRSSSPRSDFLHRAVGATEWQSWKEHDQSGLQNLQGVRSGSGFLLLQLFLQPALLTRF